MNMLPARLVAHAGGMAVDIGTAEAVPVRGCTSGRLEAGQAVILGGVLKTSSRKATASTPTSAFAFRAAVTLTESLGNETLIFTTLAGTEVISRMARPRPVVDGEVLSFLVNCERLHLFDRESAARCCALEQFQEKWQRFSVRNCENQRLRAEHRFKETVIRSSQSSRRECRP